MASIQLPPYSVPVDEDEIPTSHDYSVDLEGTEYRIKLFYRERSDRWYLDLLDADDNPMISGRKMCIDRGLFGQFVQDGLPDGELILLDTDNSQIECSFADLGARCVLVWIPYDDFTAEAEETLSIEAIP